MAEFITCLRLTTDRAWDGKKSIEVSRVLIDEINAMFNNNHRWTKKYATIGDIKYMLFGDNDNRRIRGGECSMNRLVDSCSPGTYYWATAGYVIKLDNIKRTWMNFTLDDEFIRKMLRKNKFDWSKVLEKTELRPFIEDDSAVVYFDDSMHTADCANDKCGGCSAYFNNTVRDGYAPVTILLEHMPVEKVAVEDNIGINDSVCVEEEEGEDEGKEHLIDTDAIRDMIATIRDNLDALEAML